MMVSTLGRRLVHAPWFVSALIGVTFCSVLCGCQRQSAGPASGSVHLFVPVQDQAGLLFTHVHGGSGRKYMIETMGSGGGFLDYDNDGWLDIYLVQSGPLPGFSDQTPLPNKLYRNNGDGTFTDVTEQAGLGDTSYGMGCAFGDIDNDGFIDIFVTNFGPNKLYRNNGDGTFTDVTERAGVGDPRWGSSAAFADYDGDGFLDLYVVNYVNFSLDRNIYCGEPGLQTYCHPDVYDGVPDILYRNNGDGTFTDVTRQAGLYIDAKDQSKGLGVVWSDYDNDGDADIFVANDSTRQFLFRNNGNGTFTEIGVSAGFAYNGQGKTTAGMGIDAGDYNGDGFFDLFITNLDFETNTLYHSLGDGSFEDRTDTTGLAAPSLTRVGFGTNFFDFDNDGDVDLFVANGHIIDNIARQNPSLSYEQPAQLYENLGRGPFADISARAGAFFRTPWVGRGAAFGDVDNDGDVDILQTNNNQRALLLRNEIGHRQNWVMLKLASRHRGRDAIGARVTLVAGDLTQIEEVRSGSSYLSQNDLRVHFGIGNRQTIDYIEIRWPEGLRQRLSGEQVRINQITTISQPQR
ncbi:MAG: CRTAC1 family protein [Acidobacteriota bacterium]|nr:CRTAC1 family protein [Blastocatellia bacterium]MDW8240364.1 CRTAC1 family protein [Acidobacteriota bacterium]